MAEIQSYKDYISDLVGLRIRLSPEELNWESSIVVLARERSSTNLRQVSFSDTSGSGGKGTDRGSVIHFLILDRYLAKSCDQLEGDNWSLLIYFFVINEGKDMRVR